MKTSLSTQQLHTTTFDTPLGPMTAVADEKALYLLEFGDDAQMESALQQLQQNIPGPIVQGETPITLSIKNELQAYFAGHSTTFTTPLHLLGTPFQCGVWRALQAIPHGTTCSYTELAQAVQHPTAYRAVANANGANRLAIVIPCHRVINSNGQLGGYAGGIARKEWLLQHERRAVSSQQHSHHHLK